MRSVCDFWGVKFEKISIEFLHARTLEKFPTGKILEYRHGHPGLDALGHISKPIGFKLISFSSTSDQNGGTVAGFTILHETTKFQTQYVKERFRKRCTSDDKEQ